MKEKEVLDKANEVMRKHNADFEKHFFQMELSYAKAVLILNALNKFCYN